MTANTHATIMRAHAAELLNHPVVSPFHPAVQDLIRGQVVLVTGAGGSIGSEIVRQLRKLDAGKVYMLDQDESALHSLQLDLVGNGLLNDDTTVLADIRDRARLARIFCDLKPAIVFHAAANKHLPLLERYPAEAVKTNVLGTWNVIGAVLASGAKRLVNVSTDKAALPLSILGATKRIAELLVSDSNTQKSAEMTSVRFGNVLGSRGSLLPSLAWQFAHCREITLTDQDATRFFMTIPQAAGLVIEAAEMASEGEIYILDMGDPIRIVDLVNRYATMIGKCAKCCLYRTQARGETS